MLADIYIASSLRAFERRDGVVGFVIEAPVFQKPPATLTQFGTVQSATLYQSELLGMKHALMRLKPDCILTFYIESSYIAAAVEKEWLYEWEKAGWKNSRGETIANQAEWEAVAGLIGDRKPRFKVGTDHKYKRWLRGELDKRMQKHARA